MFYPHTTLVLVSCVAFFCCVNGHEASAGWVFRRSIDYGKRANVQKGGRAKGSNNHKVEFMVKMNNEPMLQDLFRKVSDPNDESYGNYQTRSDIASFTSNHLATTQVSQFLENHNVQIVKSSMYGEHIYAEAPIAVWEGIFATQFFDFHHSDWSGTHLSRAPEYSLPQEIHPWIHSVRHVSDFPFVSIGGKPVIRAYHTSHRLRRLEPSLTNHPFVSNTSENGTTIPGYVTPAFLTSHYNITTVQGNRNSIKQGIFSSLDQYISPSDLTSFQTFMKLPLQPIAGDIGAVQNRLRDSPCKSSSNCAEGNLDAQYLTGIASLVPTYNLYYEENDFVSMLENVTSSASPPSVISISYGSFGVDEDYAARFNTYAQIAGTMGITIVVASGDDGVHDPRTRLFPFLCDYSPAFPAYSPYVLTVGATQNAEKGSEEIGCSSRTDGIITSGGGFSPYDPLPDWQAVHVNTYFSIVQGTSKQPVPGYATNARGYPDLSLLGTSYITFIGGKRHVVYGTSASAPVIAGMISLLNVALQQATGRSNATVGFINPLLYQHALDYVVDITSGDNLCAAESLMTVCCSEGFYATEGWDPMTGLGVPNFSKLLSVVINTLKK